MGRNRGLRVRILPQLDAPAFEFRPFERLRIRLWDHGWLRIDAYNVDGPVPRRGRPDALLEGLLRHRIYRDSYAVPESWTYETEGTHGPFFVARLKPSDFHAISFDELEARLDAHLEDDPEFDDPPDDAQWAEVRGFLAGLPQGEVECYRLAVDLESEKHRHSYAFLHLRFAEYLVLHRGLSTLHLLVFCHD